MPNSYVPGATTILQLQLTAAMSSATVLTVVTSLSCRLRYSTRAVPSSEKGCAVAIPGGMLATEADRLSGELGAVGGRPSVGAVVASVKAEATWLVSSEKAKTEHSDLNAALSRCSRERTRQLAALTVELRLARRRRGALFRRGQPAISTDNSTTASRMQKALRRQEASGPCGVLVSRLLEPARQNR